LSDGHLNVAAVDGCCVEVCCRHVVAFDWSKGDGTGNLNSPFGLAVWGGLLSVSATTTVSRCFESHDCRQVALFLRIACDEAKHCPLTSFHLSTRLKQEHSTRQDGGA
jgi:hypothetical protein